MSGLSDWDGRDTLNVVSVPHLGLENTLVRPARCSYGHQNRHRKINVAVVVVIVFTYLFFNRLEVIHFGCIVV